MYDYTAASTCSTRGELENLYQTSVGRHEVENQTKQTNNKLRGLTPRAKYPDRETATRQRS
jgi:hypothetical protein